LYCESLRQVSAARKEIPGRRGYPGYLYTDLATIYERAGRIKNKPGSITLLPVLTMPEDDKTHPIPDLTGYICLDPSTEIILADGTIVNIGEFAYIFSLTSKVSTSLLSWDHFSPLTADILRTQILPAPSELISLQTNMGTRLLLTGDHRLLIDTPEGPRMVCADSVKLNDYIYSAAKLTISKPWQPSFLELLCRTKFKFFVHLSPDRMIFIRQRLKAKFRTLKKASQMLEINYQRICNPDCFLEIKELMKIIRDLGIFDSEASSWIERIGIRNGLKLKVKWQLRDFLYLLGLIASDGAIISHYRRVDFANKNKELLEVYKNKLRGIFANIKFEQRIGGRSRGWVIRVTSTLFVSLCEVFELKQGFRPIFKLPENHIVSFLAGYLDGDGSCDLRFRRIKYKTNQEIVAKRLVQLLKRLGILPKLYRCTQSRNAFGSKRRIFEIVIGGRCLTRFATLLNQEVFHSEKKKRLNELAQISNKSVDFEFIPQHARIIFRLLRNRYGFAPKDIDSYSSLITGFENGRLNISKGKLSTWIETLRRKKVSEFEVCQLRNYCSQDFILEKITKIESVKSKSKFVYDLTVPKTNKFLVESGLVVSNCEGQIILSRQLHRGGVYPPIDVLPSLSRLKDKGIGKEKTREDHSDLLNQLFACYARGKEARELAVILGEAALSDEDKIYLKFSEDFENEFVRQQEHQVRNIQETLDIGWRLLSRIPRQELKRIRDEYLDKYYHAD